MTPLAKKLLVVLLFLVAGAILIFGKPYRSRNRLQALGQQIDDITVRYDRASSAEEREMLARLSRMYRAELCLSFHMRRIDQHFVSFVVDRCKDLVASE